MNARILISAVVLLSAGIGSPLRNAPGGPRFGECHEGIGQRLRRASFQHGHRQLPWAAHPGEGERRGRLFRFDLPIEFRFKIDLSIDIMVILCSLSFG